MATTMTMKATMKAVRMHGFGGPDVLAYEDVPRPEPAANEILVRVRAAGVNPVDWKIREGHLGTVPLPALVGIDFSGTVESVGTKVTEFRPGDPVFGTVTDESGSYAEYAITTPSRIARRPASLDDVNAAALPVASLTAWQALFDTANLQPGQKVLIHAAAGGVGGFGVQFGKWKKAYVIGTASSEKADFVRELGANEVIDYRSTKFEDRVRDADVVFDTIGSDTQERSWRVLKKGGILVSVVQPPQPETAATHGVRGVFMRCDTNRGDQAARIADLVVSGQVKIHVETVLPLEEARKAHEISQRGHARGKIVLTAKG